MKRLFVSIAFATATLLAQSQTAQEIVSKHTEAIGGKPAIEKIQNVVMEGNMNVQGMTINVTVTKVPGKLFRQDISAMGKAGYDLTTDKEGWTFMPFLGHTAPVQKTPEEVKAVQEEMNVTDGLYNYENTGDKLELAGKEAIAGKECFKLKRTGANGKEAFYFIDPATYYLVRISETKKISGVDFPVVIDFSDFKEVEGVKMPFTMGTPQGNITFTTIRANQQLGEKVYSHN